MEYVKSFRELEVYKFARKLSAEIFEISKKVSEGRKVFFHRSDQKVITICRSSNCRGLAKRKYEKHFISKLTDADGEQLETQHWIETGLDCSYISKEVAHKLLQEYASIGKMLNSMINKAGFFCNKTTISPITDN